MTVVATPKDVRRRIVSAASDGTIVRWIAPLAGQARPDRARDLLPRELSLADRESALR